MIDPLLARAQLAIEESWALQNRSRTLQAEHMRAREELVILIFESAAYRSETKAHRDNREK